MSGEDQERFEDYLELENYISALQAEHKAQLPAELTPTQVRIYRMAALFRAASPGAADPSPEFAAKLHTQLEDELYTAMQTPAPPKPPQPQIEEKSDPSTPAPLSAAPVSYISRRNLLTGGAVVAASLALGAGIGISIEHAKTNQTHPTQNNQSAGDAKITPTDPWTDGIVGDVWHFVTTLEQLGNTAVRFTTDTIVGYVLYDDNDTYSNGKNTVIAMSAACTHRGCIVQWNDTDRKFHCPCHGGLFSEYGTVDQSSGPILYLTPLPRLETKVENGNIYVKVPVNK